MNPMKHQITITALLILTLAAAHAEAPELKNMMPNSYQKLARLSEREERAFMENAAVIKAVSAIDDYHLKQKPLSELHRQVFAETDCGLQFYRLLVSTSSLEAAYTAEYKSKTVTADECLRMQTGGNTVFQIVFLRTKANALQNIGVFPYAHFWASQGEAEGFTFNDLMIKPLNKDEIGFFVTEVSVAFAVDRSKWDENKVKIDYYLCKNQIVAYSRTWFSKYRIDDEERIASKSKDSIDIQASPCLFDSKCPFKYSIQNAFDGNPATSYVENTEDDLMKLVLGVRGGTVTEIALINGYAANEKLYYENNRIKKLGKSRIFSDNSLNYQIIPCLGSSLSFTEVYNGDKYNDTCIAEVNLKVNNNWFYGDIHD